MESYPPSVQHKLYVLSSSDFQNQNQHRTLWHATIPIELAGYCYQFADHITEHQKAGRHDAVFYTSNNNINFTIKMYNQNLIRAAKKTSPYNTTAVDNS